MPLLPAVWAAAARLSGRLDLSSLTSRQLATLDTGGGALRELPLPEAHRRALAAGRPCEVDDDFVTVAQPAYPRALRRLPHAPPVLFYRGALSRLDAPCVAIVGTRRCTELGRRMARSLATDVRMAGGVVVSTSTQKTALRLLVVRFKATRLALGVVSTTLQHPS